MLITQIQFILYIALKQAQIVKNIMSSSSSFFYKQQSSSQSLIYDSTAFLYFAIAICTAIALVISIAIIKGVVQWITNTNKINALYQLPVYRQKIADSLNPSYGFINIFNKISYVDFQGVILWRLIKMAILMSVAVGVAIGFYVSISEKQQLQLSGFDPYQILNVNRDAAQSQIKKAYRKLALELHPDRHVDRHVHKDAASKFILLSKAYKCLTDDESKQNCLKYGNPDGQISYRIGIGLPSFMLNNQYQFCFVLGFLVFLLVIVPYAFMRYSSNDNDKKNSIDKSGNYYINYKILHNGMICGNMLNLLDCCLMFSCMQELSHLQEDQMPIQESGLQKFRKHLHENSNISDQIINEMDLVQVRRCQLVYQYVQGDSSNSGGKELTNLRIAAHVEDMCEKIIRFSLAYGRRENEGNEIGRSPDCKVRVEWVGVGVVRKCINFSRSMISRQRITKHTRTVIHRHTSVPHTSNKMPQPQLIDSVPQTKEYAQYKAQSHLPIQQTEQQFQQKQANCSKQKQQQLESQPQDQQLIQTKVQLREFVLSQQQFQLLPQIKMAASIELQQKKIKRVTANDVPTISVRINKLNKTPGLIVTQNYPFLAEEKFILLISLKYSVLSNLIFKFGKGIQQVNHTFKFKKPPLGKLKIHVRVLSLCYPGQDLYKRLDLEVLRKKETQIHIHEQDKNIQKIKPNMFEYLITLNGDNQSDLELSEGEDDQIQQKQRKPKTRKKQGKRKAGRREMGGKQNAERTYE